MAAIYQWFTPEDLDILTTTLYPIVVFDKVQLGVSLIFGTMTSVPLETYSFGVTALGGNVTAILLSVPLYDEAYNFGVTALSGNITKILLNVPLEDEAYSFGVIALSGNIRGAIVPALMPDEGMQLGCSLISGSMTHV